ncbi:MAG TPA: YSC84-related protein [Sedimentisphaerales bacterium]|nr:YSC84-related protein [Sedimentisphaerales bacterium]
MRKTLTWMCVMAVAAMLLPGCSAGKKGMTIEERRQAVANMEAETLQRLYKEAPDAKAKVENAPGYGVFSNANINLLIASAGGGYGVVVDNATKQRTYMKMALGGVGLGLGAKDYRVVMVFKDKATMDKFVEKGWGAGAHADAAAKTGDKGAEASVEGDIRSGIEVFSMTEAGLALQATIAGTKYWKDKELN